MVSDHSDSYVMPSRLECIDDARNWTSEQLRRAGFDEDSTFVLHLAMTEAISNVIRHAYGGAPDKEVHLTLATDEDGLRLGIRDFGAVEDPATFEQRDLDSPGSGGYGVHIIEELMDDVTRETPPEGGTLLTLSKRRSETAHG